MWTLKRNFIKKNNFIKENHSQPLKLEQIIKTCHSDILQHHRLISITGGFKKVAHAVRNSELFRIWSKKL